MGAKPTPRPESPRIKRQIKKAQRARREQMLGEKAVAQEAQLEAMSPHAREAAMWDGRLSLNQLAYWTRRYPAEVPKINGEWAWIVMTTPEYERER